MKGILLTIGFICAVTPSHAQSEDWDLPMARRVFAINVPEDLNANQLTEALEEIGVIDRQLRLTPLGKQSRVVLLGDVLRERDWSEMVNTLLTIDPQLGTSEGHLHLVIEPKTLELAVHSHHGGESAAQRYQRQLLYHTLYRSRGALRIGKTIFMPKVLQGVLAEGEQGIASYNDQIQDFIASQLHFLESKGSSAPPSTEWQSIARTDSAASTQSLDPVLLKSQSVALVTATNSGHSAKETAIYDLSPTTIQQDPNAQSLRVLTFDLLQNAPKEQVLSIASTQKEQATHIMPPKLAIESELSPLLDNRRGQRGVRSCAAAFVIGGIGLTATAAGAVATRQVMRHTPIEVDEFESLEEFEKACVETGGGSPLPRVLLSP